MVDIRRANIDGKLYNVIEYEEFCNTKDTNNNISTAIQIDDTLLPIRITNDNKPGIRIGKVINKVILPDPEDEQYKASNIIDLGNTKTMKELIDKQVQLRNIEEEILTSPDNITIPNISKEDSPEMRGLKEAIIEKHIDFDKYGDRFGDNFANDKRVIKGNTITQKMLKRILKNIDVKATLILEDTSPDVPNPIGKKIVINITDDDE